MKNYKIGMLLSFVFLMGLSSIASAANGKTGKVVLNELLIQNESNVVDDYGQRSGWVEVFNKSFGSVDLAGYKLRSSSQAGDTLNYIIPKGDVMTVIKPRQHALFWADQQPNRGTFHTTLSLNTTQNNWVGLYDNSGNLLDQIVIKTGVIGVDESYARESDAADKWVVKSGLNKKHYVTPSTNNTTVEKNPKVDKFQQKDANGVGMSITAMSVVFSGLLILFISFYILGKVSINMSKRNATAAKESMQTVKTEKTSANVPANGEVYAAIAMALHEYEGGNIHDNESGILTITAKSSPWNVKSMLQRVLPTK